MRRYAKAASILIAAAVMVATGAAAEIDYTPQQNQFQTDMEFFIEELPPTEDFEIIRNGGSLDGIPIAQFSSDIQGRVQFTAGVSPRDNGVNYVTGEGWSYTLQFQNGTDVQDIRLYYAFDWHSLDTFDDNATQWDRYDVVDLEGSGNKWIKESPTDSSVRVNMGDDGVTSTPNEVGLEFPRVMPVSEVFSVESSRTSFGSDVMRYKFGAQDSSGHYIANITKDQGGRANFVAAIEDVDGQNVPDFVVYNETDTSDPMEVGRTSISDIEEWRITFILEEANDNTNADQWMTVFEYATLPRESWREFTSPAIAGNANDIYGWNDFDLERDGQAGLEWNTSDGFVQFFDDIDSSSKTLETRNTDNGTILGYRLDADQVDTLRHLWPPSGQIGTATQFELPGTVEGSEERNLTVQYLVPSEYQVGTLEMIIEDAGGNTVTVQAENDVQDLDGACFVGDRVTSDCIGNRISFISVSGTTDVFTQQNTPVPGDATVRYRYTAEQAEEPDLVGDTFETDPVPLTFLASAKEIAAVSPSEGVTLTTLFPSFVFDLFTQTDGEASLLIDASTQSQWSVGSGFNGQLEHTPASGLSEGDHTWRAEFVGDDGDTVTTETRNFTVNTSLAQDINFTLHEPAGGETVTDRDVTLRYSVEASDPGNLSVVLNNEVVETRQLAAGTHTNLTTQVLQIELGDYSWSLQYDTGTHLFESGAEQFTATEDIDISLSSPADGATVDTLPIIFEADVSVGESGTVGILIDGEQIAETESVSAGTNETVQIESSDVETGKHTVRVFFDSDRTGNRYTSDASTFTLLEGAAADVPSGGELGQAVVTGGAAILGLGPQASLSVAASFVSLAMGMFLGTVVASGVAAGVGVLVGIAMFTIMQWYPAWIAILLVVLAGYIIAREASGGRR